MWIIDFEASSLSRQSYPIEVGITDGENNYSSLIRPMAHWSDWNTESEAIHNIPKATLDAEGTTASEVAYKLNDLLGGQIVYCDCAEWDGFWANVLFSDNGIHQQFEIRDIQGLFDERGITLEQYLLAKQQLIESGEYTEHRALDDAVIIWQSMGRAALCWIGIEN